MALANYSDLRTAVASWVKRSDLATEIVDFIALAEAELNRRVRIRQNMTTASLSLTAGAASVSLPAGFLEDIELNYADTAEAINRAPFGMIDFSNTSDSVAGRPTAYAITTDSIIFDTEADQTYSLLLRYYTRWQIATDSTNWLLINAPDCYLFGAIAEAGMWTRDAEMAQMGAARMNAAIERVLTADSRTKSGTLRVDPALVARGRFNIDTGE